MSPYSNDLRIKIMEAYKTSGQSQRKIAARFGVSLAFVQSLLKRYRQTGSIAPKPHGGGQKARIGPIVQSRMAEVFAENPNWTISDARRLLEEEFGLYVSDVTIYRMVEKMGIKKSRRKAPRPRRERVKVEQHRKARGASS